jgi:hypothetical protein
MTTALGPHQLAKAAQVRSLMRAQSAKDCKLLRAVEELEENV